MIRDRGTSITSAKITTFTIIAVMTIGIILTILTIMMTPFTTAIAQQGNHTEQQQDIEVRVQNTTISVPAPNAKLNNQSMPHQIVIALPLRQDDGFGQVQQHLLQANL